jgi:hypothetical protein
MSSFLSDVFLLPTRVLTSSLYHPAVVSFLFYPMPSSCRMPFTTISADLLWLHSSGKSSPIHRRPLRDGSLSSSCPSGDLKVQDFPRGVELSRSFATFCPFPTRLISKIRASVTAAAAKYPSVLSQLRQVTISMDFAQPRYVPIDLECPQLPLTHKRLLRPVRRPRRVAGRTVHRGTEVAAPLAHDPLASRYVPSVPDAS